MLAYHLPKAPYDWKGRVEAAYPLPSSSDVDPYSRSGSSWYTQ